MPANAKLITKLNQMGLYREVWAECLQRWIDFNNVAVIQEREGKVVMTEFQCPLCDECHESAVIWSQK